ncbi:MAG: ABC transporter permease [Terriglobales bacterium]
MGTWLGRWRARRQFERDMRDEMELHIHEHAADLQRDGVEQREALRLARIRFGRAEKFREGCRASGGYAFSDLLRADLRYAARSLARQRGISAAMVLTLGVGIGISCGLFALANAVVLRGPTGGKGFVRISASYAALPPGLDPMANSWRDYAAFRDSQALASLAAWGGAGSGPVAGEAATDLNVPLAVTCNFFEVYGLARPERGRLLAADDCGMQRPVAVITDTLAREHFGGADRALGQSLTLHGVQLTVVGIVRAPFAGQIDQIDTGIWIPYSLRPLVSGQPGWEEQPDIPQLAVEGQLRAGATQAAAQAELRGIARRVDGMHPELGRHRWVEVTDGSLAATPEVRRQAAWGIGLTVLLITLIGLIAAANVTSMLLARGQARRQEMAIRLTMGASGARLLRLLGAELLLLAAMASAMGAWLAWRLPPLLAAVLADPNHPFTLHSLTPDGRVFVYLGGITLLAAALAGMSPALETLRVDVAETLKGKRGLPGGGSPKRRVRQVLMAGQVALSFVLVTLALSFTAARRALVPLAAAEHGYRSGTVLAPRIARAGPAPSDAAYRAQAQLLGALPGADTVAMADAWPGSLDRLPLAAKTRAAEVVAGNRVSPEYFRALGIAIIAGRGFAAADAGCRAAVCPAVVSLEFARRFGGAQPALGKVLHPARGGQRALGHPDLQIVGVAANTKGELDGAPEAVVYQVWSPAEAGYLPLVRFSGPPGAFEAAARRALRRAFPGSALTVRTLLERAQERAQNVSQGRLRQLQWVLLLLGVAAVMLTAAGTYGNLAFELGRRTREMGVRIALGASRVKIYALCARAAGGAVGAGLAAGMMLYALVAMALQRLMAHGNGPLLQFWSPAVLLGGVGLVAAAGVLAGGRPARRATRTDPVAALREE